MAEVYNDEALGALNKNQIKYLFHKNQEQTNQTSYSLTNYRI